MLILEFNFANELIALLSHSSYIVDTLNSIFKFCKQLERTLLNSFFQSTIKNKISSSSELLYNNLLYGGQL